MIARGRDSLRTGEDLAPDRYAAELGTQRLRRYGHFAYTPADGASRLLMHESFVQPEESNLRYIGTDRRFEPLTDSFAADPLLHAMLASLGPFRDSVGRCPHSGPRSHRFAS